MPCAEYIAKNGNFTEAKVWQSWMEETAKASNKFMDFNVDRDGVPVDPFSYNEAASISHLVTGATKAGMVSLAEYVTEKAGKDRRFNDRYGRADFWLSDANNRHWEFEFKQPYVQMSSNSRLEKMMGASRKDALKLLLRGEKIKEREISIVAGRIFHTLPLYTGRIHEFDTRIRELCAAKKFDQQQHVSWVRHGWKISPRSGFAPTYLVFDVLSAL